MANLTITRGDLFPPLTTTLEQKSDTTGEWEPLDLTAAESITLVMVSVRPVGTRITGACTIAAPSTSGVIEYPWEPGDTDVAGQYRAQFEIVWSNTKPQTVPNEGYEVIEIQPDLDGDA